MSENPLSFNITKNVDDEIPSILVSEDLLNHTITNEKVRSSITEYKINDSLFEENEEYRDNGELTEFEVYVEKVNNNFFIMENEADVYCSTPAESDVSECEDDIPTKELDLSIQNVPHGIIINSNVYLTNHQWHTMIFIDIKMLKCGVCEMYCDLESCSDHMDSYCHIKNLASCKPLKYFDLSITRKIRNTYHCGVCNELFDITNNDDHYGSKTHEGNLLFAINKVSDLMYNNNVHTHENENIDSTNDTHNLRSGNGLRQNNNDWYHFDANAINNFNDSSSSHSYEIDNDFECNEPVKGTSYATMARKPKSMEMPKFLNIDLGAKMVKIRFDSWHMIVYTKLNEFYCMVCQKHDHVRYKAEHCMGAEHVGRLARFKILDAYEDYLIRIVDDKLFHCGHCNNLQVIPDMAAHIESSHPKKNKNIIDDPKPKNLPTIAKNRECTQKSRIDSTRNVPDEENRNHNTKNDINGIKNNPNGSGAGGNENNGGSVNDVIKLHTPDIYSDIVIYPFGYKLNIPILSYNIVYVRPEGFYCKLCDFLCTKEEVNGHIYSLKHIERLQRVPFIFPFSCNLIRAIRDALHCGICNIPVAFDQIYEHNMNQAHTTLLARALRLVPASAKDSKTAVRDTQSDSEAKKRPLKTPSVPQNESQAPISTPVHRPQIAPVNSQTIGGAIRPQTTAPFRPQIGFQIRPNSPKPFEKSHHTQNQIILPKSPSPAQSPSIVRLTPSSNKTTTTETTSAIKSENADKETITLNESNSVINEPVSEINEPVSEINERDADFNEVNESCESFEEAFDSEEYVYIKLRNIYFRITCSSYNTLVHIGDGSRYCFVCSSQVEFWDLKKHVESRGHVENVEKYKYLDKYEDNLLRQIYLMYHCSICNVLICSRELKTHLDWPPHTSQTEITHRNVKKLRKNEIKCGIKEYTVATQKESIFLHEKEPKIKINVNVKVVRNGPKSTDGDTQTSKKNKMIIFNNNVLKISHYHWNGLIKARNMYKCVICQKELGNNDVESHLSTDYHGSSLSKPFEKQYYPALIRQVNDNFVNCLTCNTELPNRDNIIDEHVNGKKHGKNYENVQKFSSQTSTYSDCDDDILTL